MRGKLHERFWGALLTAALVAGLVPTPALAEIVSGPVAAEAAQADVQEPSPGPDDTDGPSPAGDGDAQSGVKNDDTDTKADDVDAAEADGQKPAAGLGGASGSTAEGKDGGPLSLQAGDNADIQADEGDADTEDGPAQLADRGTIASGEWGTCQWEISDSGVLTVGPGTGENYTGNYPDEVKGPWTDYADSITSVVFAQDGTSKVKAPANCMLLFCGLENLKSVDTSGLDTSSVTNMFGMFGLCTSLQTLDLSNLDTSHVTDMTAIFQGCSNLTSINTTGWDTRRVTNMSFMFYGCPSLTSLDLSRWNTSSVTDMNAMFYGCSSLASLDLSGWNTSRVESMWSMFADCPALNVIYVGDAWSTESVGDGTGADMFSNCDSLVGGAGTAYDASHTGAEYARVDSVDAPGYLTYKEDPSDGTIASGEWGTCPWVISSDGTLTVRSGTGADYEGTLDEDLKGPWTDYARSITSVVFLEDEEGGKVVAPEDCTLLLYQLGNVTSVDTSGLDTSAVVNMMGMFAECASLTSLDLSGLDTRNVTGMNSAFYACSSLETLDLSGWDTGSVADMSGMFAECASLTSLDLSGWNTRRVESMSGMFADCPALRTIYVGDVWSTESVDDGTDMFSGCDSLVGGAGTVYSSDHTDADYARVDGGEGDPGYLTSVPSIVSGTWGTCPWEISSGGTLTVRPGTGDNTSGVCPWIANAGDITRVVIKNGVSAPVDCSNLFEGLSSVTSVDISHLDTSSVTTMASMFQGCANLSSLDVANWDTGNLVNTNSMFKDCSSLVTLDLYGWDTEDVTSMAQMFWNCSKLETIYVGGHWSTAVVTQSDGMFNGCAKLKGGAGTTFSSSHTDVSYAHDDGGEGNPGYLTFIPPIASGTWGDCPWEISRDGILTVSAGTGTCVGANTGDTSPWAAHASNITSVVFRMSGTNKVIAPANCSSLFRGLSNVTSVDASDLDTSSVESMARMFRSCSSLTALDLSDWDTTNVESMSYMFDLCESLTTLDLSGWDTANVVDMRGMFQVCSSLTSLDLSSWDTGKLEFTFYMFNGCSALETVYVGDSWSTVSVASSDGMFSGCSSLIGGNGTVYDADCIDASYAHVDGQGGPGYLTLKIIASGTWGTCPWRISFNGTLTVLPGTGDGTSGACPWVDNAADIKRIVIAEGVVAPADCSFLFSGLSNVTSADISDFDTSAATTMKSMFYGCAALKSVDASGLDTSAVETMQSMFHGCAALESVNTTGWDTSAVETMRSMFEGCSKLANLNPSSWNTRSLTDASLLFKNCSSLTSLDIASWNTSAVTSMQSMFEGCSSLASIDPSGWDTGSLANTNYMFKNCSSLVTLDLYGWDTEDVTSMAQMFWNCSKLETIYVSGLWTTAVVTQSDRMFNGCTKLRGGAGTAFSSSHTDVSYARIDCGEGDPGYLTVKTIAVGLWGTCLWRITLDGTLTVLSGTGDDTSGDCPWSVYNDEINSVVITQSVLAPADCSGLFWGLSNVTTVDASGLDTTGATNMSSMFYGCSSLNSLNTTGWNTANVTSMADLFNGCSSLTSLDLSEWNTANVTSMSYLFNGCSSLTSLDLSEWNTTNVTYMNYMFYGCSLLESIRVGDVWSTRSVDSSYAMFGGCSALVGSAGTLYDSSNTDAAYAHIDGGEENPGYLTLATGIATGTWGDCSWMISKGGLLTVHPGTGGNIASNCPWADYADNITSVIVLGDDYSGKVIAPENCTGMFAGLRNVVSIDASGLDVSSVVNMTSMFVDCTNLASLDLSGWDTRNVQGMGSMFSNCSSLTTLDVTGWNTGNVTEMYSMFYKCASLESLDLSDWDTGRVTNMRTMFEDCSSLETIYVGNLWSTASVRDSSYMFMHCSALVGGAGTTYSGANSDATYARVDSAGAPGYLTHAAPKASGTWGTCEWEVSRSGVLILTPGTGRNTSGACPWANNANDIKSIIVAEGVIAPQDCSNLFKGLSNVTRVDASRLDTSSVTTMAGMFQGCSHLSSLDLSGWSTGSVTSMQSMFEGCTSLSYLCTDGWNTANVTKMAYMFKNCTSLTSLRLSSWRTGSVTDMRQMFWQCSQLRTITVSTTWLTDSVTQSNDMFYSCDELVGGAGTTFSPSNTDAAYARIDGGEGEPGYLTGQPLYTGTWGSCPWEITHKGVLIVRPGVGSNYDGNSQKGPWDGYANSITSVVFAKEGTSRVVAPSDCSYLLEGLTGVTSVDASGLNTSSAVNMRYIFRRCSSLVTLDLSSWDTSSATNMNEMFDSCSNLAALDLSGWDTRNVIYMRYMFADCSSLTSLDLSSWNTGNVYNMDALFNGCSSLRTIYVSESWSTASVEVGANVFTGCTSLMGGAGSTPSSYKTNYLYARIDGGEDNPGYLTYKEASPVTYTVTWLNGDGSTLKTEEVARGVTPEYEGETPTKAATDEFTYAFAGWDPEPAPVAGDVTYTPVFDATVRTYAVTWVDGDGETLKVEMVAYGATPAYEGPTPTKEATAQHTYEFNGGWSPEVVPVDGTATYEAQFDAATRTYAVTWVDGDGHALRTDDVPYGEVPEYEGGTPTKASSARYDYAFNGTWDPEPAAVTGDATYEAQFDATTRKYAVTFVDEDGTTVLLAAATYEYGTTADQITRPADPTKASTQQYSYTFDKWVRVSDNAEGVQDVTGDATYKATYTETARPNQIVTQPVSTTARAGDRFTLTVEASGNVTSYKWQASRDGEKWSDVKWSGHDGDTLSYTMQEALDGRMFRCVVTFDDSSETSDVVSVTLPPASRITSHPQDATVAEGQRFELTVVAEGATGYSWQASRNGSSWSDVTWSGHDTATLGYKMVASLDNRQFRCVVTFSDGTTETSEAATLTLATATTGRITAQPQGATVAEGQRFELTVVAEGATGYSWQASRNGTSWSDVTWSGHDTATLGYKMVTSLDNRQFRCVVTFSDGATETSEVATITLAKEE